MSTDDIRNLHGRAAGHRSVGMRLVPCALCALLGGAVVLGCSDDETSTGGHGGSGGSGASAGTGGSAGSGATGLGGTELVTVEPTESTELFANPGMGWQTFHQFADTDPNLAGLPSGSAYIRWTWRDLEPNEGDIRLDVVSDALARARAAGQTLMFRVMLAGSDSEYSPDWLGSTGCTILSYSCGGDVIHAPDIEDPTCRARHDALINALGAEFGDEPDIEVDIGSVGLWGEWHFSGTEPQIDMPALSTLESIIDLYDAAFPSQPRQALIGDLESLAYATEHGAGWRADCLGDLGFFSPTWNHMEDLYQQQVAGANAQDAWTQGPVAWETCYTMQQWVEAGYDVHYILQYALDMHGSFVNNKSAALPAGDSYRQEVEQLLARLGYRLVLRSLGHPPAASPGATLPIVMSWENLGVAPPYHALELALRLSPTSGTGESVVLPMAADLTTWLPGAIDVSETVTLPAQTPAGSYALSVGVLGTPGIPMVNLAIDGRDADGWYPLSSITVP